MAFTPPRTDPRTAIEASVLPVVAKPRAGLPAWAIVLAAVLLGLLLFFILDARRKSLTAPALQPRPSDTLATPAPPPPLFVPPGSIVVTPQPVPAPAQASPPPPPAPPPPRPTPEPAVPAFTPQPQPSAFQQPPPPPPRVAQEATLVIDTSNPGARASTGAAPGAASGEAAVEPGVAGTRASAGVLANRTTTVPQGTLIAAVLETAMDSTKPGLARAIVSRDVRGFDGSRVLIPRGSRLIGEYGAQVEHGQKRMLVNWIRLIRPDGVTIAIGSPATDTLGQGGIKASVNTHFFERFAGAILQSALDLGVTLAASSTNSPVIFALPGAFQGAARVAPTEQIKPTLKVKAATSISVFVARDLDFGGADGR